MRALKIAVAVLVVAPVVASAAPAPAGERPATGFAAADAVTLSTGERVELIGGGAGTGPGLRIAPPGGDQDFGRYALSSVGGNVRVRPLGRAGARTTELRTGAPARAAAAAAATYPVRFTIDNENGVAWKLLYIWDRATWTLHPAAETMGPDSQVDLPAGDYFAVALYDNWSGGYLLSRTFAITNAGRTVRFDESAARAAGITLDVPASRLVSAMWISVPGGLAGFAGREDKPVYVTPFTVPGASLRLHEILGAPGSSFHVPSPVRYDLYHEFTGHAPNPPVATVARAGLARTETTVRGQAASTVAMLNSVPVTADWTGVYLPGPVPAPGTVTEYVTPDHPFRRLVFYRHGHLLNLEGRILPAGPSEGQTVGRAPFAPRRGASSQRRFTTMSLHESAALSDPTGTGYDSVSSVSLRLRANGQTVASATDIGATDGVSATVPSNDALYQFDHTVTRAVPWSRLSTLVRSEWTFFSAGTDSWSYLPLIDVDLDADGLDERNRAGATPVRLTAVAANRLSADPSVTGMEFSVDDGATWSTVPITATGEQATADLSVPADAAYVSLRLTAANNRGGSLIRTIIRAFAGPAPSADETVGPTRITGVTVNGGKPVLVGKSATEFVVEFTATDPTGIAGGDVTLYRGRFDAPDAVLTSGWGPLCDATGDHWTCRSTIVADQRMSLGDNALSGEWSVAVWAHSSDRHSFADRRAVATVPVLRRDTVTANAGPEPVRRGDRITVTGKLTRANWDTGADDGLGSKRVLLQFRPAGTSTYRTVGVLLSGRDGALRATATATVDGYWRFAVAGAGSRPAVISPGDLVDVR